MHKFKVTSAKGGQYAAKFTYNAETLVWSENYKSRASARNCIESLKKNGPTALTVDLDKGEKGKGYRFEIAKARNGEAFVRFVARNGQTMVRSETYSSKAGAINCIESIKKNGPAAPIEAEA